MEFLYDVDPERALPMEAYRPSSFGVDMERVFRRDWVFVATADEVASPGDHVAVEVGGQPVIVLRTQAGELTALSNLCAHRGTLLVDGRGNGKRFQCPYHAWTFDEGGRLLSVPHTARNAVDRDAHCLPTYRAEEWHGFVFATLDPEVPSLAERFAHLEPLVAEHGVDALHHWTAERTTEEWQANWKLAMSNAMESYHLFKVHPKTLEPFSPTADAYYIVGGANGSATGGATTRSRSSDYLLLSLLPNIVVVISDGNVLWQAVHPLAHDRTRVTLGGAYPTPPAAATTGLRKWTTKAVAKASEMATPDFIGEDKWICERGQRAATGDFRPGPIVPMEHVITDFHHYLNRQLHGAAVPEVRTSAQVGVAKAGVAEAGVG